MKLQENGSPSLALAKREAGDILAQKGNRLLLIEAILLVALNVSLYVVWHNAMALFKAYVNASVDSAAWSGLTVAGYVAVISLTALFLTLPSLIGLLAFAKKIACGGQPVLSEVFEPFSSAKSYAHALRLSWSTFWRLGLTVGIILLTDWLLSLASAEGFPAFLCGLTVFAETVGAVLLWIRRFPCPAVALSASDASESGRMPERNLPTHTYRASFRFFLGFLPWILLGLLTLGILLLWEVFPRMLIAYFRYLGQENEMIIQSEE